MSQCEECLHTLLCGLLASKVCTYPMECIQSLLYSFQSIPFLKSEQKLLLPFQLNFLHF